MYSFKCKYCNETYITDNKKQIVCDECLQKIIIYSIITLNKKGERK